MCSEKRADAKEAMQNTEKYSIEVIQWRVLHSKWKHYTGVFGISGFCGVILRYQRETPGPLNGDTKIGIRHSRMGIGMDITEMHLDDALSWRTIEGSPRG